MLKIGELSDITGVSVKTIRYYEEEGLICPVEVDRWTNYRYYDDSSINRLSEIVYLKDLGFSLKEIRNLNETVIQEKIKNLQLNIKKLTKNIYKLSNLKSQKGELIMKNFVNDEQLVGKWQKIGVSNSVEAFKQGEIFQSDIFDYKTLYFLPNGEEYWVFSWTKGSIYLKNRKLPYQVINGNLIIGVVDLYSDEINYYAIYKQVDNKHYKPNEICVEDNINLPFIKDEQVVGSWEAINYINDIKDFDPSKKANEDLFITRYIFEADGKLIMVSNKDTMITQAWTKGLVLHSKMKTASEYIIKKDKTDEYMIVEWKSGDYVYGGKVTGYYVLKKVK